ncbi:MAG: glycosyltransferase [Methylocystaceae bacterium]|nr:glycosyltransferase [Methylocystaceae bacterium]
MVKLAMVMIARNEQNNIIRALESVRPFVDDMIVLDTGSTDQTALCASHAGARVFDFRWCDDFSIARNAALDHSHAEWNFVLDADEYIVQGGHLLKNLLSSSCDFVGAIAIDSAYGSSSEKQQVRNWLTRILPGHIRYTGRVHEQPDHCLPIIQLPVHCRHDGYLTEIRTHKKGRNENLLLLEIDQNPDDPYLHYQMGKEKEVNKDFIQALNFYKKSLDFLDTKFADWHRDLILRTLFCMKMTKNFESGLKLAFQWKDVLYNLPDYHFVLGDFYLDMALASPEQADTILPLIEGHWLRCLEIGEKPEIDGCVMGRGSILAEHNLHAFYSSLGLHDQAALYKQLTCS